MYREPHSHCWLEGLSLVELHTIIPAKTIQIDQIFLARYCLSSFATKSVKTTIQDPRPDPLTQGKTASLSGFFLRISLSLRRSSRAQATTILKHLETPCIVKARTAQQRQPAGMTSARFNSRCTARDWMMFVNTTDAKMGT